MEPNELLVSVVVPIFNEEPNLNVLYQELINVSAELSAYDWEFVFVDDGSDDDSWRIIKELQQKDTRINGISFTRNYGHQLALLAGLENCSGDAVISMDADLQHPPEVILDLLDKWNDGNQIVSTVRKKPEHIGFFKKVTSRLFYRIFTYLSGVPIEAGMADFRLLDKSVVTAIKEHKEQGVFLRGLIQTLGFKQTTLSYNCRDRYAGERKYSITKMLRLAWTAVSSFSLVPLRLATMIGFVTSLFAFGNLVYTIYSKFFGEEVVPGWATIVSLNAFLLGVLFLVIGVLGEYLGRVFEEVRGRPRYLIKETLCTRQNELK